jgi:hypothetical protein
MSLTLAQRFDTFHRSLVLRPGVKEQAGKRVASIAKLVQSRLGTPHLVGSYARAPRSTACATSTCWWSSTRASCRPGTRRGSCSKA